MNNLVIHHTAYSSTGPQTTYTSIADSGATAHFVTVNVLVINKQIDVVPLAIYNPNDAIIYSTHTAEINVPSLPRSTRVCHIVLGLRSYSLISIGQLCDAGCEVLFLIASVSIGFKNAIIMQGARARDTGLWHLDLSQPSPSLGTPPITMSLLLSNDGRDRKVASSNPGSPTPMAPQLQTCLTAVGSATPQALVTFSNATLFSPGLSTLTTALAKGFLFSPTHAWPHSCHSLQVPAQVRCNDQRSPQPDPQKSSFHQDRQASHYP
jgi:hypothetical protein